MKYLIWTAIGLMLIGVGVMAVVNYKPHITIEAQSCNLKSQISVMEEYGDVKVYYISSHWKPKENYWDAAFETRYDSPVSLRLKAKGDTVCEAVSNLYDQFQEFPLKKKVEK
jgi:hypothetical protein